MQAQQHKWPRILLFTTPTCSWCRTAKNYFRQERIPFKEIDVTRDAYGLKEMIRVSGQQGVPVITINNRPIVGFDKAKIERILKIN